MRNKRRQETERGLLKPPVQTENVAAAAPPLQVAEKPIAETSRKEERTLAFLADTAIALAAAEAAAAASPKRNVRKGRRRKTSAGEAEVVVVDAGDGEKQREASNNQPPKDNPLEGMNEACKRVISAEENAGGEKEDGADISNSRKGKEIVVIDDDDNRNGMGMDDETASGKAEMERHGRQKKATLPAGSNVVSQQPVNNPVINSTGIWFCLVPSDKQ